MSKIRCSESGRKKGGNLKNRLGNTRKKPETAKFKVGDFPGGPIAKTLYS